MMIGTIRISVMEYLGFIYLVLYFNRNNLFLSTALKNGYSFILFLVCLLVLDGFLGNDRS